jgi:V8-like Glu-specific endopeptidase
MKLITLLAATLFLQAQAFAGVKVIYGQDNRKDVYQVHNPLFLKLAKSTAGMIPVNLFKRSAEANCFDLHGTPSLEAGQNVCPSESFSQQPLAPSCSGFLVGPDTLITAGHCYKSFDTPENVCKDFAWVFEYDVKSPTHNPTQNIPLNNIYLCKQVLSAELNYNYDFAIIKLDRKVVGREPLKFRSSGKISNHTQLVVIGHPSGLPMKISDGGKVTKNNEYTRFSTTLDTFHGNSGSAVFDAKTGLLEGILIMGKNDYQPSIPGNPNSCMVVNKCDDFGNNCSAGTDTGPVAYGEIVLRINSFQKDLNSALKMN